MSKLTTKNPAKHRSKWMIGIFFPRYCQVLTRFSSFYENTFGREWFFYYFYILFLSVLHINKRKILLIKNHCHKLSKLFSLQYTACQCVISVHFQINWGKQIKLVVVLYSLRFVVYWTQISLASVDILLDLIWLKKIDNLKKRWFVLLVECVIEFIPIQVVFKQTFLVQHDAFACYVLGHLDNWYKYIGVWLWPDLGRGGGQLTRLVASAAWYSASLTRSVSAFIFIVQLFMVFSYLKKYWIIN